MNNKKYLYWLNTENEFTETVWREMYSRIGVIVHLSQMIEYNLANILAISKMKNRVIQEEPINEARLVEIKKECDKEYRRLNSLPLGKIKNSISDNLYINSHLAETIENILKERNYIIHNVFKDDLFSEQFKDLDEVEKYIDELNDVEFKMRELNNQLLSVFKENRIQSVLIKR